MFLTRLHFNQRSRAVRRDLASTEHLHRSVLSLFPQVPNGGIAKAREHFAVLYRVDQDQPSRPPQILIQSQVRPDWSVLPPDYLLPSGSTEEAAACRQLDPVFAALRPGRRLAFRLRANPTKKIGTKTGPDGRRRHGKRVDLRGEAANLAWLQRKGREAGFKVLAAKPTIRPRLWKRSPGRRFQPQDSRGKRLTFADVRFDGVLEVVDTTELRRAIETGIGPAKAYGFGLLSLASVSAA